jgi:hypothetical protein
MPLPTSRRQAALEDLRNRLAFITVAKGYNTDAGRHIFLGEAPRWGPDDPPAGLAIAIGDDSVQVQGGIITASIPLQVWAVVPVAAAEPLVAIEAIIADIKEAVEIERDGSVDRALGVLEGSTATEPRGLARGITRALRREEGSEYVGAAVEYVATLQEQWGGGGR